MTEKKPVYRAASAVLLLSILSPIEMTTPPVKNISRLYMAGAIANSVLPGSTTAIVIARVPFS